MHWSRRQKIKGQGHTVTKTVTVARLLVTRAAMAVCCCCRRGSACRYDCLCFLLRPTSTLLTDDWLCVNLCRVTPEIMHNHWGSSLSCWDMWTYFLIIAANFCVEYEIPTNVHIIWQKAASPSFAQLTPVRVPNKHTQTDHTTCDTPTSVTMGHIYALHACDATFTPCLTIDKQVAFDTASDTITDFVSSECMVSLLLNLVNW